MPAPAAGGQGAVDPRPAGRQGGGEAQLDAPVEALHPHLARRGEAVEGVQPAGGRIDAEADVGRVRARLGEAHVGRGHAADRQRQGVGHQAEALHVAVGLVDWKARQGEAVRGGSGGAGMLAEGGGEAGLGDGLPQGAAHLPVGIGEQRRRRSELGGEAPGGPGDVAALLRRRQPGHVGVGVAVVADGDQGIGGDLAQLRPAHVAGQAEVERLGGDEEGERQAERLEAWPGLAVDGERGVVDGDGDTALGQGLAVAQAGDDLGERQHPVGPGGQLRQVRLELLEPDRGGRQAVLAEAVVHQDGGAAAGRGLPRGRRCRPGASQRDGQRRREQSREAGRQQPPGNPLRKPSHAGILRVVAEPHRACPP